MSKDPNTSITSDLIAFAKAGEHTQFQYLRNFRDYLFIKETKQSILELVNRLVLIADNLFNEYCVEVSQGSTSVEKLLTYKELDKLIDFYEEEYLITLDVLQEFEAYMKSGHILDMILFRERESKDLWDHRRK